MSGTRGGLRRSNRAPRKVDESEFAVGDKVEVQRSNAEKAVGTLTQNLTEGTASSNPRWMVRYEKGGLKDEDVYEHTLTKIPPNNHPPQEQSSSRASSRNTSRNPSPVSTKPKEKPAPEADPLSSEDSAKASAREARSKRRQAKIEEVPKTNGKNGKNKKQKTEENCSKIKLLTGTLYIYRGRNRRAEFVRRL